MKRRHSFDHILVVAVLLAAGLVLFGCTPQDQSGLPTSPGDAIAQAGSVFFDFITSFARNALAAFVL
jgi:hypothetical protein